MTHPMITIPTSFFGSLINEDTGFDQYFSLQKDLFAQVIDLTSMTAPQCLEVIGRIEEPRGKYQLIRELIPYLINETDVLEYGYVKKI